MIGLGLLAAIGVYAYPKLFQTVNSRLARHVEKELNQQLNVIGLSGNVEHAKFIEGEGIEISGIQLTGYEGNPIAGIDSAFIHAPVQLPELLSSKLNPSAIELSGATLTVTRSQNGRWDLEDVFARIKNIAPSEKAAVPIILRDSQIQIVDQFQTPHRRLELNHLEFQTRPLGDKPEKFAVAGSVKYGHDTQASFLFEPGAFNSSLRFRLVNLPINQATLGFLPQQARPEGLRSATGTISGSGQLILSDGRFDLADATFDGHLQNAAVDHQRIPHLVSNCSGSIKLARNELVADLTGQLGTTGQFGSFQSKFGHQLNSPPNHWTAKGNFEKLVVDSRLANYFGPGIEKFFADFEPEGLVNVSFDFEINEQGLARKLESELLDMSFKFVKFPYPVAHAKGTAKAINDQIWFDLAATEQGQPMGLKGTVKGKGPTAMLEVDFWNEGQLPIDKKLARAISATPKVAQALFDFRPSGFVKVYGQIRKSSDQPRAILNYDAELIDCQAQHVHFEYPIGNINGTVFVRDNFVTISDVFGSNGKGQVKCNGTWSLGSGLELSFDAFHIDLDQRLRNALTDDIGYVWDAIRPSGNAFYVHVDLTNVHDDGTNVVVESVLADPKNKVASTVAINPLWFPYSVGKLEGRVFVGNGEVRMNIDNGYHDQTRISCLGNGDYDSKQWSLKLSDMMVGGIVPDDDLLNAVPESLRESLSGLDYQGSLSGFGSVTMRGTCESNPTLLQGQIAQVSYESSRSDTTQRQTPTSSFEMDWDVRLDMDRGQFNVGMIAENVFGSVRLSGNYDGQSVRCGGGIAIDSLHWQDLQFTDVQGPIWIENDRVAVGSMARSDQEATTPNSLTGNLFGGSVRLDAQSWTAAQDRFFVQASVSNIDVSKAGQQLAPSLREVGGAASLAFRVGGGETTESMEGEGFFQLRNAKIYELPVVLSMLQMMKTRRRDRTAFDASNADFTIRGDTINVTKMELLGDAISLIGTGELNMEHEVHMDFYTVAGRNKFHIPILTDLAKASSQQILWLKVDGALEDPQVHSEILPGLNESVRQLFQTPENEPPSLERAQSRDGWNR